MECHPGKTVICPVKDFNSKRTRKNIVEVILHNLRSKLWHMDTLEVIVIICDVTNVQDVKSASRRRNCYKKRNNKLLIKLYATWNDRNPSTLTRPLMQPIIARVEDFKKMVDSERKFPILLLLRKIIEHTDQIRASPLEHG